MVKELRAARIKRGRGMILEALIAWEDESCGKVSGPVDRIALQSGLQTFGMDLDVGELQRELDYLEERKYLTIDRRKFGSREVVLVSITAQGRDVFDGIRNDDTILVDNG